MRREVRRTVLLFQASLAIERQEPILLEYAREHRYTVTSLTASPSAALALVRDHMIDIVLVCISTPGTDELGDLVRDFGGVLEAVRQRRQGGGLTVDQRNARLAQQAAERGATPEMIAAVLGMPLRQVLDALAARPVVGEPRARDMYIEPVERRPLRSEDLRAADRGGSLRERRPQVLRPAPDHPWRTDNRAAFPDRPADDPQARTSPVERAGRTTRPLDESSRTQRIHRVPRPTDEADPADVERPAARRPRAVRSA